MAEGRGDRLVWMDGVGRGEEKGGDVRGAGRGYGQAIRLAAWERAHIRYELYCGRKVPASQIPAIGHASAMAYVEEGGTGPR